MKKILVMLVCAVWVTLPAVASVVLLLAISPPCALWVRSVPAFTAPMSVMLPPAVMSIVVPLVTVLPLAMSVAAVWVSLPAVAQERLRS